MPETIVNAIECPKCGYIIYSRARHDFRECACGSCHIDGGFDYMKAGAPTEMIDHIKSHKLTLPITRDELYDDWNHNEDKYGSVAPCGEPLSSASWAAAPVA